MFCTLLIGISVFQPPPVPIVMIPQHQLNPDQDLSCLVDSYFPWKTMLISICLLICCFQVKGQTAEEPNSVRNFSGSLQVTQNGISLIPSFSLGKPATLLNFSIGGEKVAFEPQLRFGLDGKPWSFVFWWRYKGIKTDHFSLNVGVHPAISFRRMVTLMNGHEIEDVVAKRFLTGELAPTWLINKNSSLGIYYLHAFGFDQGISKNTDFLALNGVINNINLFSKVYLNMNPQLYLLRMDEDHGYYVTSNFNLRYGTFPISIGSIVNKAIDTEIAGKEFIWNISLIYSFNQQFERK